MDLRKISYLSAFFLLLLPLRAEDYDLQNSWIVSPSQAKKLVAEGAKVLDARPFVARFRPRLAGAVPIDWEDFSSKKEPNRGKLLPPNERKEAFQKTGLSPNIVYVVVGDPDLGWGEEGRIVWMLRQSGHNSAYYVDGGAKAFAEAVISDIRIQVPKSFAWDFSERESITKEEIQKNKPQVLDVREEREFLGETPYGEKRGGHIPGAKWVYYKDLFQKDGKLLPKEEIRTLLLKRGILPGNVALVCTGGVRSAWATGVLKGAGYIAKNYPGGMWEWASSDPENFPVRKGAL